MGTRTRISILAVGLVLVGTRTLALGPGDYNGDGVVDLADFAEFTGCMAGPGESSGGCDAFDFDADTDVDLFDFAEFQRVFGTSIAPPGMVLIPGGEFEMGDSFDEGGSDEKPVHTVSLSPYCIDIYEVTNEQYVDALNWALDQVGLISVISNRVYQPGSEPDYLYYCAMTGYSQYSRITWNGSVFGTVEGKEDHPVVMVTWYGAVAYCNWRSAREGKPLCYDMSSWTCDFGVAGYRLPTEAEWEKAAGWDPDLLQHFRFSEHTDGCGYDCLDGQRANFWNSGSPYATGTPPYTTPVGFYNGELHSKIDFGWPGSQPSFQTQDARSYYGCYDMTGNVSEFCHDWYLGTYYSSSPVSNPTGPASGYYRIHRGGNYGYIIQECRSAYRATRVPDAFASGIGFRCAVGAP